MNRWATHQVDLLGALRDGFRPALVRELIRAKERHGDYLRLRLLGPFGFFILSDPAAIQHVMVDQQAKYVRGEPEWTHLRRILGNGLILSDGEVHRTRRRIVHAAFTRKRLDRYAADIVRRVDEWVARWRHADDPLVDIHHEMTVLTLFIIRDILFRDLPDAEALALGADIAATNDAATHFDASLLGRASFVPTRANRRLRAASARIDRMIHGVIAERLARPGDREDVLSVLLGYGELLPGCEPLDATAARDEIVTLLAAGHETLACMLTWTWHLLAQNPEAERALHDEVDEVAGDGAFDGSLQPRLRYTMRVMRESMRLYPPVWVNGRQAAVDDEIEGRPVKRGDMFWTPSFLVHRDARWFPDPLRFDPDRFLPEAIATRPRFAYFPYGGGNRQCVGQALAELEGPLLIAAIARAFAPRSVGGSAPELVPMITLQPKGGLPMRLVRRTAARPFTAVPAAVSHA